MRARAWCLRGDAPRADDGSVTRGAPAARPCFDDKLRLPEEAAAKARRVVGRAAERVLRAFARTGYGNLFRESVVKDLLEVLNLNNPFVLARVNLTEFATVQEFVDTVRRGVEHNHVLLAFALAAEQSGESPVPTAPSKDPNPDETLVLATHYALVLHAVCKAIMDEPKGAKPQTLVKHVSVRLARKRARCRWTKHATLFEQAKVFSIDIPFREMRQFKRGRRVWGKWGGYGLSLNILEAMVLDASAGSVANAQAGFELMLEPAGRKARPGWGGNRPSEEVGSGNIAIYPPFPEVWADLYSAWNMAFVSRFPNAPFFLAKLLAPQVLCTYHNGREGEYMMPRVLALKLHIHYEMFTRARNGSRVPAIDWRNSVLTDLWGAENLRAARVYAHLVSRGAAQRGPWAAASHALKTRCLGAAWAATRGGVAAATGHGRKRGRRRRRSHAHDKGGRAKDAAALELEGAVVARCQSGLCAVLWPIAE